MGSVQKPLQNNQKLLCAAHWKQMYLSVPDLRLWDGHQALPIHVGKFTYADKELGLVQITGFV